MKTISLCVALILSTCVLFAQKSFNAGYYVDNSGIRVNGFLETNSLSEINEPNAAIIFKKTSDGEMEKINPSGVSEFGIGTDMKFQKFTVKVDDSSLFKDFKGEKEPTYSNKTIFLNTIVDGDAKLYQYESDNGIRFFYTIKNAVDVPLQLVYKKYIASGSIVKENNNFREQLFNNVKCENQTADDFLNLTYEKNELSKLFLNYNKCNNSNATLYLNKSGSRAEFNFTVFGGLHSVAFKYDNLPDGAEARVPKKTIFSFGGEAELVMRSKKWAAFARVEFEKFSSVTDIEYYTAFGANLNKDKINMDLKMFEILLGPRYYIHLNSANKIFVDVAVGFSNPSGNIVRSGTITNGTGTYEKDKYALNSFDSPIYFSIGAGYVIHKRFGVELKLDTNKTIISGASDDKLSATSSRIGANIRYTIF